ncbi:hypothetical protein [Psychrobacillus sp. L4]|uniref:hypothetical protein n=1 Tax=Psychrobacillus sp. L4 TaxID=3236892 RepID=UPI0036F2D982
MRFAYNFAKSYSKLASNGQDIAHMHGNVASSSSNLANTPNNIASNEHYVASNSFIVTRIEITLYYEKWLLL